MVEMKFIILKLIGVDMCLIWMEKKIKTSSQYWVDIGLVIFITHHFIMTPCFKGKCCMVRSIWSIVLHWPVISDFWLSYCSIQVHSRPDSYNTLTGMHPTIVLEFLTGPGILFPYCGFVNLAVHFKRSVLPDNDILITIVDKICEITGP